MKLRVLDYLTNIQEFNGVSLAANLQCTCGATEFRFFHTGKQTKGILAPFIVGKAGQLALKAVCPSCLNSITVYDSSKDGSHAQDMCSAYEFVQFESTKAAKEFSVAIKYNYRPENLKTGETYTNQFENCFIYIVDGEGKEGKALVEE